MNTLNYYWTNVTIKPFLAQSNTGLIILVTDQGNNSWYQSYSVVLDTVTGIYRSDGSIVIVNGTESIWTLL